ncbi:type I restriction enzyme endonuclease domain-containing protein [Actinacidiphila alni]|uniref:type I restriction enzyme endonuclease domain-containing protein n=1 Tax=Actinacidiphila alni TaxID=380248 RepID=UPI0034551BB9
MDWRELAFYDAVANHGTTRSVMDDEVVASIARELVAGDAQQAQSQAGSRARRSAPACAAPSSGSWPAGGTRRTRRSRPSAWYRSHKRVVRDGSPRTLRHGHHFLAGVDCSEFRGERARRRAEARPSLIGPASTQIVQTYLPLDMS